MIDFELMEKSLNLFSATICGGGGGYLDSASLI